MRSHHKAPLIRHKTVLLALCAAGLIGSFGSTAVAAPPAFKLPPQAAEVAHNIFDLGRVWHQGVQVQGYAIIHPRRGKAKPDKPGKPGKGGKETCYSFLASGAKWRWTEDYLVDTAHNNGSALSSGDIESGLQGGIAAWESVENKDIFGSLCPSPGFNLPNPAGACGNGIVDGADTTSPDDKNEVYFSPMPDDPFTIAVTIVWGVFSGPPKERVLIEWDQVYNDSYDWGDATANPGLMDFRNIATHELGHAAGMGHPADTCLEETMYRYSAYGETKKRTLEKGDKAGIAKLY